MIYARLRFETYLHEHCLRPPTRRGATPHHGGGAGCGGVEKSLAVTLELEISCLPAINLTESAIEAEAG